MPNIYTDTELVALYEVFADLGGLRGGPHDWDPTVKLIADLTGLPFAETNSRLVSQLLPDLEGEPAQAGERSA